MRPNPLALCLTALALVAVPVHADVLTEPVCTADYAGLDLDVQESSCVYAGAIKALNGSGGTHVDFNVHCTITVHKQTTTKSSSWWLLVWTSHTQEVRDDTTSDISCSGSFTGSYEFSTGTGIMQGSASTHLRTVIGKGASMNSVKAYTCQWTAGVTTCSDPLGASFDTKETGIPGVVKTVQVCAGIDWSQESALVPGMFASSGQETFCTPEMHA